MNPDYYSPENDALMSNSQYKHWLECPSRAHAMFVRHEWAEKPSRAMAEGALLDAILTEPEKVGEVYAEHADHLLKANTAKEIKAGGPDLVPNSYAENMVRLAEAVKASPVWRLLSKMETQRVFEFELRGMAWKCRLDFLSMELGQIWDAKKTASVTDEAFVPRLMARGNFIAQYEYVRQLALYREAVRQNTGVACRVGIAAFGASQPYDIRLMPWAAEYYHQIDEALTCVLEWIPTLQSQREADPATLYRCESCDWCISSRKDPADFIFPYHDPINRKQEAF